MKRILAVTSLAAALAVPFSASVFGQAQGGTPGATPPPMGEVRAAAQRTRPGADARHCLKLGTNMEIHKCAEKYRPR